MDKVGRGFAEGATPPPSPCSSDLPCATCSDVLYVGVGFESAKRRTNIVKTHGDFIDAEVHGNSTQAVAETGSLMIQH